MDTNALMKIKSLKYKKECKLEDSDITTKMTQYIDQHWLHVYDEKNVK